MTLSAKLRAASDDLGIVLAIVRNTGCIPRRTQYMVTIETTSVCNLSCPLCPTGTGTVERANKFIDPGLFARIVDVTAPLAKGYVMGMWGEPAFHPEIGLLLDKLSPLPVWTSTNLNYTASIAEELARWENLHVICAVDTLDPERYPDYRVGGSYETMLRNLDILARGACHAYPQFLVEAEADTAPFVRFAEAHGIPPHNVVIKTKRKNFRLDPTAKPIPGVCHSPYSNFFFNCDGYMLPCCNNVKKDLHLAHISELASAEDILRGGQVRQVRMALARDKNVFPSCGQCLGETFWRIRLPVYTNVLKSLLPGSGHRRSDPQRMPF